MLFTTSLVKIQINPGRELALLQQEAGAVGKSRVAPHGEEARPPVSTLRAPGRGRRQRRCCASLSGVQCGGEHSVLYCVSGKRESP